MRALEWLEFPEFPDRLRRLVETSDGTLRDLGKSLGISRQTMSRYTCGQTRPDLPYVVAIAQRYNVTVDWLLGLSGSLDPNGDVVDIAHLYEAASDEDRKLVKQVLYKYRRPLRPAENNS